LGLAQSKPTEQVLTATRGPGDTDKFALLLYSRERGFLEHSLWIARPRNKGTWRRDVDKYALDPANHVQMDALLPERLPDCGFETWRDVCRAAQAALVQHESQHVHLLTEGQTSNQLWWTLKSRGISSTVLSMVLMLCSGRSGSVLFQGDDIVHKLLRVTGCAETGDVMEYGDPADEDITLETWLQYRDAVDLAKLPKTELVATCVRYGVPHVGTRKRISERLVARCQADPDIAPLAATERAKRLIVSSLDARLYHRPAKATRFMESGTVNEKRLVGTVPALFARGENERVALGGRPGQRVVFLAERGLLASRRNELLLDSPDGLAVIWTPPSDVEGERAPGHFEIAVIEAKTLHSTTHQARRIAMQAADMAECCGVHLTVNDWSEGVESEDSGARALRYAIQNNSHTAQLLHHMAVCGVRRALYVAGSPNNALHMVDVTQETAVEFAGACGPFPWTGRGRYQPCHLSCVLQACRSVWSPVSV
jgi:hypothetical protein